MIDIKNDFEVKEFIRQHYLRILKRLPDQEGFHYYFTEIKKGNIKPEELISIFQKSDEHIIKEHEHEIVEKISQDVEDIINKNEFFDDPSKDSTQKPEPDLVFASCQNIIRDGGNIANQSISPGGVYYLDDNVLKIIYDETGCFGIHFDKSRKILFCVTRKENQIIAFKVKNSNQFIRVPIKFVNYLFAVEAHGIYINENKIVVVATGGINDGENATNDDVPWTGVGKIIVSELEINDNEITIKNSKVFNPFNCTHHHHINDITYHDGDWYLTSQGYCDSKNNYVKKGSLAKLDDSFNAHTILDKFEQPHSLYFFRDRLYVCSSANAIVYSINLKDKSMRLEYKGVNAYTRGLLVTDNYFYIGTSFSVGRTNSKFTNPNFGILKFNRNNGETTRIDLPPNCNNIYTIIST